MARSHFALLILVAAGCGGGSDVPFDETVPANGIATYKGEPLEGYRVYFNNSENHTASGLIDAEGRFTLGTNNPGDGAPTGTHRVWFAYEPEVDIEAGKEDQALILPPSVELPDKYLNPAQSGITVEITDAGLKDYEIELK